MEKKSDIIWPLFIYFSKTKKKIIGNLMCLQKMVLYEKVRIKHIILNKIDKMDNNKNIELNNKFENRIN